MPGYNHAAIEKKWQALWASHKVFATNIHDHARPKFYVLDMFPYPSGQGLHVGHPEGYTATDIIARYKRANGFNVMHPMGWDAFGLPAEQYAIKNNVHPRDTTAKNIARFREQLQAIGFSYDWSREVDTTDPKYYRWTQWIFLKLYDTWFDEKQQKGRPIRDLIEEFRTGQREIPNLIAGPPVPGKPWDQRLPSVQRAVLAHYRLAYQAEVPVNWCPGLGTVLANEEVIDGKSEVGGFPVERRPMKQWMLRITAYANRLLDGLHKLDWSDSLKEMQRNWIGQSEGAEVNFAIDVDPKRVEETEGLSITVFTTRPDTLFGATYMVLAPEHPFVHTLTTSEQAEKVESYQRWARSRSDRERQEDTKKTGEFTGSYAINPVNAQRIPIYIADYVLMGYGTAAIMAVPAHDERDHEFATKFNLPIVQVVAPKDASIVDVQKAAFVEEGIAVNSPWIEGLPTQEAKTKMISLLEENETGKRQINYKLRDWLFSRQRYWGEPFPIVHLSDGTTVPLSESELPVKLPELEDFKPTGTIDPPLSKATDWLNVKVDVKDLGGDYVAHLDASGQPARRELNTMPQWAGSCWYYLRYLDPSDEDNFVAPTIEKYWLRNGVDLYVGGVEHAVLHLLYSRFWHKVLFDRGLVSSDEPFHKLVNQGMILGENHEKMSKSRGNVVTSDSMVEAYGADSLRLFEMFMGPLEQVKPWSTAGVEGVYRFLQRVWRNMIDPDEADPNKANKLLERHPDGKTDAWWTSTGDLPRDQHAQAEADYQSLLRPLHRTIKRVTDDIERLSFNTAIAAMMEFNNLLAKTKYITLDIAETFLRLLEPFAPHFADEVLSIIRPDLRGQGVVSISQRPWPVYDPTLLIDATVEIPVQVNGKLRSRVTVPNDADEATAVAAALADPEVQKFLAGKEPRKKIFVKGRMVNLVV
ncbi:MAG TPA: leucine--tRNA ligase [Phycisphaerae bacterium]|nr:leucine--tRNA ligase [Phycisphaerae bacterium]